MKKEDLSEIKEKLENYQKDLKEELSKVGKKSSDGYVAKFPDYGSEEDDNILEVENFSENVEIEERLEGLLAQTKKALEKIENGSYGYCHNCQQKIRPERLKAYPIATTCLNCK